MFSLPIYVLLNCFLHDHSKLVGTYYSLLSKTESIHHFESILTYNISRFLVRYPFSKYKMLTIFTIAQYRSRDRQWTSPIPRCYTMYKLVVSITCSVHTFTILYIHVDQHPQLEVGSRRDSANHPNTNGNTVAEVTSSSYLAYREPQS
jgi:hypothetical protein